jgi:AraC-like DNA-binding protein
MTFKITTTIITCIILGLLLIFKPEKNGHSAKNMGVAMLIASIMFSVPLFYRMNNYDLFYKINILAVLAELMLVPITTTYFVLLTTSHLTVRQHYHLFLAPFLIWAAFLLSYLFLDYNDRIIYVQNSYYHFNIQEPKCLAYAVLKVVNSRFICVVIGIQILASAIYVRRCLSLYNKRLGDFYSNTNEKGLEYANKNFVSLYLIYAWVIVYCVIPTFGIVWPKWFAEYKYIIDSILIFVLGRGCLLVEYTSFDFDDVENKIVKERASEQKKSIDTKHTLDVLDARLLKYIEEDEIYKQSAVTLSDLAKQLNTNTAYLSKVINNKHHQSFSDYINSYRIEFAKKLLTTEKNSSLEWVGLQSGFSNYNSFYVTFRKFEGITPSTWRKNRVNHKNL